MGGRMLAVGCWLWVWVWVLLDESPGLILAVYLVIPKFGRWRSGAIFCGGRDVGGWLRGLGVERDERA